MAKCTGVMTPPKWTSRTSRARSLQAVLSLATWSAGVLSGAGVAWHVEAASSGSVTLSGLLEWRGEARAFFTRSTGATFSLRVGEASDELRLISVDARKATATVWADGNTQMLWLMGRLGSVDSAGEADRKAPVQATGTQVAEWRKAMRQATSEEERQKWRETLGRASSSASE
jgi:hypothetical protein